MSGSDLAGFLGYWEKEGERYVRHGDYDWVAAQVAGRRVLEIGCGPGFSSEALLRAGCTVLALDNEPACLAATAARIEGRPGFTGLQADLTQLDAAAQDAIAEFAPEVVCCWLIGAPGDATGARPADGGKAVAAYRENIQRRVAELAATLPGKPALHIVDRTAMPWQAKDIGRDTLVRYHLAKTLRDLPFTAERKNALYRKLEDNARELASLRQAHPALKGVVPVLGSLIAERI